MNKFIIGFSSPLSKANKNELWDGMYYKKINKETMQTKKQCTAVTNDDTQESILSLHITYLIPYLHFHPGHGRARFCLHWASFTLAKLVNLAKTVSARISARVKCKHTPSPSELFCSYVLYVI